MEHYRHEHSVLIENLKRKLEQINLELRQIQQQQQQQQPVQSGTTVTDGNNSSNSQNSFFSTSNSTVFILTIGNNNDSNSSSNRNSNESSQLDHLTTKLPPLPECNTNLATPITSSTDADSAKSSKTVF